MSFHLLGNTDKGPRERGNRVYYWMIQCDRMLCCSQQTHHAMNGPLVCHCRSLALLKVGPREMTCVALIFFLLFFRATLKKRIPAPHTSIFRTASYVLTRVRKKVQQVKSKAVKEEHGGKREGRKCIYII